MSCYDPACRVAPLNHAQIRNIFHTGARIDHTGHSSYDRTREFFQVSWRKPARRRIESECYFYLRESTRDGRENNWKGGRGVFRPQKCPGDSHAAHAGRYPTQTCCCNTPTTLQTRKCHLVAISPVLVMLRNSSSRTARAIFAPAVACSRVQMCK